VHGRHPVGLKDDVAFRVIVLMDLLEAEGRSARGLVVLLAGLLPGRTGGGGGEGVEKAGYFDA